MPIDLNGITISEITAILGIAFVFVKGWDVFIEPRIKDKIKVKEQSKEIEELKTLPERVNAIEDFAIELKEQNELLKKQIEDNRIANGLLFQGVLVLIDNKLTDNNDNANNDELKKTKDKIIEYKCSQK